MACAGAWALGTSPWLVGLAALLYVGAWAPGMLRVGCLLAAPLLLALVPLEASWQAAAWLVVAGTGAAPLWLSLGGRVPWQGMLVAWALAAAALLAGWLTPWRVTWYASDVGVRSQVVLLALVVWVAAAALRTRRVAH